MAKPPSKPRGGPRPLSVNKSSVSISKHAKGASPGKGGANKDEGRKGKKQTKKDKAAKKQKQLADSDGGMEKAEVRPVHIGLFSGSATPEKETKGFKNKEKVLILSSRGIVYRYRHLMEDMVSLLPHSKKEPKVDVARGRQLNDALVELMDLRGCSLCLFFEMRKRKDLYLWMTRSPSGPSVKFLVSAVHTMEELKLTGNHLKGSRPFLTFSPSFDSLPHLRVLKELFIQMYATPRGHRKSKPFYDHVITFTFLDNRIWFRNYQICIPGAEGVPKIDPVTMDRMSLVEVGPRFCLNPIRIFSGSFGGTTLFENPLYVSPNAIRAKDKRKKGEQYRNRVEGRQEREQYRKDHAMPVGELAHMWDGKDDEEEDDDAEEEEQ